MQVLCSDHHDRKHILGILHQDMAWKCTGNRTQTTAQRHKLRHLSLTLSVYATSLLHPLYFIHSLHALSLSCTLRLSEEVWCHVHHTLDWGMMSTHSDMSFPKNPHAMQPEPFSLVLLEDNQSITLEIFSLSSSHAPSLVKACSTGLIFDSKGISHFSQYLSYIYFHVTLETFWFPLDWWDYVGVLPLGVQVRQAPTGHKQL